MSYMLQVLKEKIGCFVVDLIECIKKCWRDASDKCKAYTIGALVLLLIFTSLNIYEMTLNNEAEMEIENTADEVFDPLVYGVEILDEQTQEIMEPIKDFATEVKLQWIKLAKVVASLLIGLIVGIYKKPFEEIKDVFSETLSEERDNRGMWAPFYLILTIDIIELLLTFM